VEHVGLVLSGQAVAKMDDGTERLLKVGDFFSVPPGHDSWVVGDEPQSRSTSWAAKPSPRLPNTPNSGVAEHRRGRP
jgi:quercetin dioxygenase-like cupin family protein